MAASSLTTGNDTSGGSSATTPSFTLPANQASLAVVLSRHGSLDPNQAAISGWTVLHSRNFDNTGSQKRLTVLGIIGDGSTAARTITFGGQAQTDIAYVFDTVPGTDVSSIAAAIGNIVSAIDASGAGTSLSAVLSFLASNSMTYGAIGVGTINPTVTPGANFTKISDADATANGVHASSEFSVNAQTTVGFSSNLAGELIVVAIELRLPAPAQLTTVRTTNRYTGPMALRRRFKRSVPAWPIVPTFIPNYPDQPLGMNIGNDQTNGSWNAAENDADLIAITARLRRRRIRIALPTYSDAAGVSNMRQLALTYKANGYFVSYGVTGLGATQDATTYAAWKAQVPTEAAWAAANKIDRFYIGNEEDWQAQISNYGSVTDATVRTDVLALATSLKASYPNMEIVYSSAQGTLAQWIAAGAGDLDKLGFNMYDTLENFAPNIVYFKSQIGAKYFVSEWGSNYGYYDMVHSHGYLDINYANDLASRYQTLVDNAVEAYFFAYRYGDNTVSSGNYNIIDNNNNPLPGYEQAFGAPALPWPPAVPARTANRFVGPMALRNKLKFTARVQAAATQGPTSASITKSLQYEIHVTPSAVTKSLQYAIRITPGALTKALQYAVKKAGSITKSLQYTIKRATSTTKSLKYSVKTTAAAVTKSLAYTIDKPRSVTESLQYTIKRAASVTKQLQYALRTAQSKTKSLQYTVKSTPTAVQKSLRYVILGGSVQVTKSLKYTVLRQHPVTKSLQYAVKLVSPITKVLAYGVQFSARPTKQLVYRILQRPTVTLALTYQVKRPRLIQKSLRYVMTFQADLPDRDRVEIMLSTERVRLDVNDGRVKLVIDTDPTSVITKNERLELPGSQLE